MDLHQRVGLLPGAVQDRLLALAPGNACHFCRAHALIRFEVGQVDGSPRVAELVVSGVVCIVSSSIELKLYHGPCMHKYMERRVEVVGWLLNGVVLERATASKASYNKLVLLGA